MKSQPKMTGQIDPSDCLLYKNNINNEMMWIGDFRSMVERRDQLMKEMDESIFRLDSDFNASSAFDKNSKTLLVEINEKGRQLALINAKLNCVPISPPNPTIKDIDRLVQERNYLVSRIQQLEKEARGYQNQIILLGRLTGEASLPKSRNPDVTTLMAERNLRIKMITRAMQFQHELAEKKVLYEMQTQRPYFNNIYDSLNGQLNNYTNIINLNRSAISIIDDRLRRLDQTFLWNLVQIDEDLIQLICKREKFEQKLENTLLDISKVKSRIGYINFKFNEFNNVLNLASKMNALHGTGVACVNPIEQQLNGFNNVNKTSPPAANGISADSSYNSVDSMGNKMNSLNIASNASTTVSSVSPPNAFNQNGVNKMLINALIQNNKSASPSPPQDSLDSGDDRNLKAMSYDVNEARSTVVNCAANADTNDDLVLKDLDKEIEKAIHQVEDIVQRANQEISK